MTVAVVHSAWLPVAIAIAVTTRGMRCVADVRDLPITTEKILGDAGQLHDDSAVSHASCNDSPTRNARIPWLMAAALRWHAD